MQAPVCGQLNRGPVNTVQQYDDVTDLFFKIGFFLNLFIKPVRKCGRCDDDRKTRQQLQFIVVYWRVRVLCDTRPRRGGFHLWWVSSPNYRLWSRCRNEFSFSRAKQWRIDTYLYNYLAHDRAQVIHIIYTIRGFNLANSRSVRGPNIYNIIICGYKFDGVATTTLWGESPEVVVQTY